MKRMMTIAAIASLFGGGALVAQAQEPPFPEDHRKEIMQERFAQADLNGDGRITQDEVDARRAQHFAEMDADGDGLVSQAEMRTYREAKREERRQARAQRQFDRADSDNDGGISLEEFQDRPDRAFQRADANGDGVVEFSEIENLEKKRGKRFGKRG